MNYYILFYMHCYGSLLIFVGYGANNVCDCVDDDIHMILTSIYILDDVRDLKSTAINCIIFI